MKRILLTTMLAVVVGSSTGCCLFDRLFCCPRGYPLGPAACGPGGCRMGRCNSCPDGAGMGDGYQDGTVVGDEFEDDGGPPPAAMNRPSGPQTGAVAYPYYTNRGPRDFFAKNPGTVGP
jgi:hypothetical protein